MDCAECGYDYDALERAAIPAALRSEAAAFRRALEGFTDEGLRARPAPGVWSPLEYAGHLCDVFEVQRERILLAQIEDTPVFVPMGREQRVVDRGANEQDAVVVGRELAAAAEALATTMDGLDPAGWARRGVYNYPEPAVRSVDWIGRHTVHEIRHHRRDIGSAAA